jgi:hypothetical protein
MKKLIQKITILSLTLLSGSSLYPYKYTFNNKTPHPMMIGIQLVGVNEPVYSKFIDKGESATIVHGKDIPSIKWGVCLNKIDYALNPTEEQKKPKATNILWKNGIILSIESKDKSLLANPTKISFTKLKKTNQVTDKACGNQTFDIIQDTTQAIYFTSIKEK